jgi:hypothetical protein
VANDNVEEIENIMKPKNQKNGLLDFKKAVMKDINILMKDKSEWEIYRNQMKIKIKNRYNNKKIYIAESAAKRVKRDDSQTFIT